LDGRQQRDGGNACALWVAREKVVKSEANLPDALPNGYELGHHTIQSETRADSFEKNVQGLGPNFERTVAIIVLAVELRGKQGCGSFIRGVGKASLAVKQPDAWRYVTEVQDAGKPAEVTGYR
jgi:hypothetical protein